jgi:hypothetical protein
VASGWLASGWQEEKEKKKVRIQRVWARGIYTTQWNEVMETLGKVSDLLARALLDLCVNDEIAVIEILYKLVFHQYEALKLFPQLAASGRSHAAESLVISIHYNLKNLMVVYAKILETFTFSTRALQVTKIDGINVDVVEERIALAQQLRREQLEKGFQTVEVDGMHRQKIQAAIVGRFLPADVHPDNLTDVMKADARRKYMDFLEKSSLLEHEFGSLLHVQIMWWAHLRRLEAAVRPMPLPMVTLGMLVSKMPVTLAQVCDKMAIVPAELRKQLAYSTDRLLLMLTVDEFMSEDLATPLKKIDVSQMLHVMQWLRTCYWFLPLQDIEWLRMLRVLEERFAEFIDADLSLAVVGSMDFGLPLQRNNPATQYQLQPFLWKWMAATLRGLWVSTSQQKQFVDPIVIADCATRPLSQVFSTICSTYVERGNAERLLHELRALYVLPGMVAYHQLMKPGSGATLDMFVPELLTGAVYSAINARLQRPFVDLVQDKALAPPILLVIHMHLLDVYLNKTFGVRGFLDRHLLYLSQQKKIMEQVDATTRDAFPIFVQRGNQFCLVFDGVLMYHSDVFVLMIKFFEIVALHCNTLLDGRNIAEVLQLLRIDTPQSTRRSLIEDLFIKE